MSTARYQNGCVYKIVCRDPEVTDCYVGSCCNFTRRKCNHKSSCHNVNNKTYNLKVYTFIREHGGWENWEMIQLKHYPCNSKRELVDNKLTEDEKQYYKKYIEYMLINGFFEVEYFLKNKNLFFTHVK